MSKKFRPILRTAALFLSLSMLLSLPAAATQSEIDDVKDNIDHLEEEKDKRQEDLDKLQEDKAYLSGKLSRLNKQLSDLAAELTDVASQLAAKEEEIRLNQQELEAAKEEEKIQYENMKKRIRFLYERGNSSVLTVLLSAESFADFLNQSEYVERIYRYDRQQLLEYQNTKKEITEREDKLLEEQEQLLALQQQQQDKKKQAESLLAEVRSSIGATNQQISQTEQDLAKKEEELKKQRAYEAELEEKKAREDAKRLEEIRRQEEELKKQQEGNNNPPVINGTESELAMLAALIECEAGGESYEGKLAVGSVVINRVRSAYFPNSITEVIYQSGQFSPVASGRFATVLSRGASASCVQAASENLAGKITVDCLYFRRNTGVIEGIVIGNHVFY